MPVCGATHLSQYDVSRGADVYAWLQQLIAILQQKVNERVVPRRVPVAGYPLQTGTRTFLDPLPVPVAWYTTIQVHILR